MPKDFVRLPFLLFLSLALVGSPARAGEVEYEVDDLEIEDWQVPGDGKTPTFLQYLDTQKFDAKEAAHLVTATSKGDIVYSLDLELPPALLKPSLSLDYSSGRGVGLETPYGWELRGIVEIRRPLVRAYEIRDKADWYEAEWLLSGPGMSGTLQPSGEEDWTFFLRTSTPTYVIADYDKTANTWSVRSNGVTWTLEAQDGGADTDSGTALWRATKMQDGSGNYATYCYDEDGRIQSFSYGGNSETGADHLVTVAFAYGSNAAERTSARAGFLTEYDKHIEKITIQSGDNTAACTSSSGGGFVKNTGAISGALKNVLGNGGLSQEEILSDSVVAGGGIAAALTAKNGAANALKPGAATAVTSGVTAAGGATTSVKSAAAAGIASAGIGGALTLGDTDEDDEEDSENRLYAYDLIYTVTDSLDLLTKIEREGKTSADAETVAEFEYTEFDDSDTAARTSTSMAPASLGATKAVSEDDDEPYDNETLKALIDLNRDGLPDVVDASKASSSYKQWDVNVQKVNHSARSFSWDGPWTLIAGSDPLGIVTSQPDKTRSSATLAYTKRQVVDFDGDGYLDILISDNSEDEWVVYYGNSTHNYGGATTAGSGNSSVENPPYLWKYAQTSWALQADMPNASSFTKDIALGLIDFNGDGWLDCYDPADGSVWLHDGERESGFSTKLSLSYTFEALRSVKYTIETDTFKVDAEDVCEQACEDGCEAGTDEYVDECQSDCEDDTCEDICEYGGEINGDDVPGRDEVYNECYDECSGDCDDISERQHYIAATDEFGALYDMNGDGMPDYVDASSKTWKVYFGNGRDFEAPRSWSAPVASIRRVDEGRPTIDWDYHEDDTRLSEHETGTPAKVYQMLIDVDGDGLLDLAMGKSLGDKWYKNTGSGFETSSRSLPGWWPDDFMTSSATSEVDADEGLTESTGTTTSMMIDLDRDGAVDSVTTSKVSYGPYPRPYLLKKVENGQGGSTSVSYRSLATVSPSGDWSEEQHTPNVRHLADEIASIDGYTGQNAESDFSYADGYDADGVFRGFTTREVERELNNVWTSKTAYTYELDDNLEPLVTKQQLYTDGNLNFGSALDRGTKSEKLRYEMTNTYDDYGTDTIDAFRLIKNRKITEYGESSDSESVSHSFNWGRYGKLESHTHHGGDEDGDSVVETFGYVDKMGDKYPEFYRMTGKSVAGTNPLTGVYDFVASESYYYDGHADKEDEPTAGLVTRVETASGWLDGGETLKQSNLAIVYERGSRGELASITDEATGIKITQDFGFGGATLKTQTNALGQALTREIDEQGRITSVTDPNGFKLAFTYDAFNRVTKKTATGADNATHTLQTLSYSRSTAPYYDTTKWYGESGSAEETAYTLWDGFGHPMQTWTQDEDGHYLVGTRLYDLRGLPVKDSHPEDKGAAFSLPVTSVGVATALGKYYHDALGDRRETVRDDKAGTGSQLAYRDSPRKELRQDEEGYQTELTYDAYGRVKKVRQGQSDSLSVTAKYEYDPLGRVAKFTDGGGTYYTYSYDAAGRLRRVNYGGSTAVSSSVLSSAKTAGAAKTPGAVVKSALSSAKSKSVTKAASAIASVMTAAKTWYTYEYKGQLKTKMTDATGAYATWDYDAIGRVKTITVSDSLPSSTGTLTYSYEYDGDWIGAVSKTTDPSGVTELEHDSFGRESRARRTYAASAASTSGQTAGISYGRDFRGRLTSKTLPSGRDLALTYAYGHLSKLSADSSGATDYTLSFAYNDWGLWSSVTSSRGHKFKRTYTTPLWPDELSVQYGSTAYLRDYKWHNNGLLKQRSHSVDTSASTTTVKGAAASVLASSASSSKKTSVKSVAKSGAVKSAVSSSLASSSSSSASTSSSSSSSSSLVTAVSASALSSSAASLFSSGDTTYSYSYDALAQVAQIKTDLKTIETYAYDSAGNPTSMLDASGATWTYASAGKLNQISSRTSDKGGSESYSYDAAGRVSEWKNASGTYAYYYDGLGRLRGVTLNGAWQSVFDYDAAGAMVRKGDNNPFTASPYYVYEFRDWRYDEKTGATAEQDNAFVSNVGGSRSWLFHEHDGHVAITLDDAGTKTSSRTLGAFGDVIGTATSPWEKNSFHGMREEDNLFHMGQRHLTQKDGQWLQPEPLLYLGLKSEDVAEPLKFATYRYAMNSPTLRSDTTGFDPADDAPNIDVTVEASDAMETPIETAEDLAENGATREQVGEFLTEMIQDANPTGSMKNCESTAEAVDSILGGTPAEAGNTTATGDEIKSAPASELEALHGGKFEQVLDQSEIVDVMTEAGSGSKAIVIGVAEDFGSAHAYNVVNIAGEIYFIDGQTGEMADSYDFGYYVMMDTTGN